MIDCHSVFSGETSAQHSQLCFRQKTQLKHKSCLCQPIDCAPLLHLLAKGFCLFRVRNFSHQASYQILGREVRKIGQGIVN